MGGKGLLGQRSTSFHQEPGETSQLLCCNCEFVGRFRTDCNNEMPISDWCPLRCIPRLGFGYFSPSCHPRRPCRGGARETIRARTCLRPLYLRPHQRATAGSGYFHRNRPRPRAPDATGHGCLNSKVRRGRDTLRAYFTLRFWLGSWVGSVAQKDGFASAAFENGRQPIASSSSSTKYSSSVCAAAGGGGVKRRARGRGRGLRERSVSEDAVATRSPPNLI